MARELEGAVPRFFDALVDDAGLFPPEQLAMADAVARHRHDEESGSAVLTGRFVCPAARLTELRQQLGDQPISISVITEIDRAALSQALDVVAGDERLQLAGLEGPVGDLDVPESLPTGTPIFVEIPITGDRQTSLELLAELGLNAKVRCGGLSAELFPSAEQLGSFVHRCASRGVPFKATAGLHHALGYDDPTTGFHHHGFLDLLVAAARAVEGASRSEVEAAFSLADEVVVKEAGSADDDLSKMARDLFCSYGSCSTSEPVADLVALGLLK